MGKLTKETIDMRLAWTLDMKIEWFCKMFSQFVIHSKGNCYQSFSAGKDSDVGRHIVDRIYDGTFKHITPNWERLVSYGKPPLVFSNTGLEFPEIVSHARTFEHTQIKPKIGFTRVIAEYGFALISKDVAQKIREIRNSKSAKLIAKRLFGDDKGNGKIPEKWKPLVDTDFKISEKCCQVLKKDPFKVYEKSTGRRPIVFTTVLESTLRKTAYMQTGCNSFEEGKEKSRPMSVWTLNDIWEYHDRWKMRFAEVYYKRTLNVEQVDGSFKLTELEPETQTGCIFCMFGVHLETKGLNRFQRLALSHPKLHYVAIFKCKLYRPLTWMKIPVYPPGHPDDITDLL